MKNKKIYNLLKTIATFILLLALCASGVMIFHSYYYELIYVSGLSMYPTLNSNNTKGETDTEGSIVDFGIIDTHTSALKNIERFDIVSTYFPYIAGSENNDYVSENGALLLTAKKKIKRVIAKPGETFKIEKGLLYILKDDEYELVPYTFKANQEAGYTGKDTKDPIELKDDEYWVLGDNRSASHDCASIGKPVRYNNLCGVLVAIEGRGTLYKKRYTCTSCGHKQAIKDGSVCKKCHSATKVEYDVNNKKYHWPKYY